ncbi:MAG: STAS domain-containing protein [Planctomycetota bacterium]|jgi:anti-anti-sigma factor|nr:STAS domain-containing protein [Planctomycetota bacterium]
MEVNKYGDAVVVSPTVRNPEVDIVEWERAIEWAIDQQPNVLVFDCAYLDLVTSMGLVFFLATHTRALENNLSFRICNLRPHVERSVRAARLHRLLHIYPTLDDALADCAKVG